jgi:hypothetical protein
LAPDIPTGDRRREVRFEVIGELWGTLETRPSFRLVNLGQGGALVESVRALSHDARLEVRLTAAGLSSVLPVQIRHVTPASSGRGYLVGLQFTDVSPEVRGHIDRALGDAFLPPEGGEP